MGEFKRILTRVAGAQLLGRGHFPSVGTMTKMEVGMVLLIHKPVIYTP